MNAEAFRSEAARLALVPLFYDGDAARARATVAALAAGGATLVEYTLRGPGADRVLAELVENAPAGVTIGAGSVSDAAMADLALRAGAAFVVGPNGDPEVAERCFAQAVAYVPGCMTPSELVRARSWGCSLLKLFPVGALGGPAYVRAVRAPLPGLEMMVTGGVSIEDASAYLEAGAACLGIGSELVKRSYLDVDDGRPLAEATAAALACLRSAREG